jgi:hypothetical protein
MLMGTPLNTAWATTWLGRKQFGQMAERPLPAALHFS